MKTLQILLVSWVGLSVPIGLLLGRMLGRLRAPQEMDQIAGPLPNRQVGAPEKTPYNQVDVP